MMPDNIKRNSDGSHSFAARRQPAWHSLGTVFAQDAKMTPAQAVVLARCDYGVRKMPMIINLPTGPVAAQQVAIVREPEPGSPEGSYHVLGYASPSFEIVQNIEIGFMLEKLGEEWPVETVGALGEGEQFFITLDAGSASVNGEEIKQYLLMSNAHDGKRAMRIALTPVRVVCQNTLLTGLSSAVLSASIPHRSDVRDDAQFTLNIISSVRKQQAAMLEEFRAMAARRINEQELQELVIATYPDPKPWRKQQTAGIVVNDQALIGMVNDNRDVAERLLGDLRRFGREYDDRMARVKGLREFVTERYHVINEEAPDIAGTAWAYYQAGTEVENYRSTGEPRSASKDPLKRQRSVANSILFGDRAANMARAYGACLELIKA